MRNTDKRKSLGLGLNSRTPEERTRDNNRIELALLGKLVPAHDLRLHCKVVGVTATNDDGRARQDVIAEVQQFDPIILRRNRASMYDANAVQVAIAIDGEIHMLGHLPADVAADVAPSIDAGEIWAGIVTRVGGFPTKGVGLILFRQV